MIKYIIIDEASNITPEQWELIAMPANKKPRRTPEQMANWTHGSLLGSCEMIRASARRIHDSNTANLDAKYQAGRILDLTYSLESELKEFYKKERANG